MPRLTEAQRLAPWSFVQEKAATSPRAPAVVTTPRSARKAMPVPTPATPSAVRLNFFYSVASNTIQNYVCPILVFLYPGLFCPGRLTEIGSVHAGLAHAVH
jgi:hypothetical protein